MQRNCVRRLGGVIAMLVFLEILCRGDCQPGSRVIRGREQPNIRRIQNWKIKPQLTPDFNGNIGRQGDVLLVPIVPYMSDNNFNGNHRNLRRWTDMSRGQRS